eukprot:jgi/Undpi1/8478/HiC_scaffold_25.g10945.m1
MEQRGGGERGSGSGVTREGWRKSEYKPKTVMSERGVAEERGAGGRRKERGEGRGGGEGGGGGERGKGRRGEKRGGRVTPETAHTAGTSLTTTAEAAAGEDARATAAATTPKPALRETADTDKLTPDNLTPASNPQRRARRQQRLRYPGERAEHRTTPGSSFDGEGGGGGDEDGDRKRADHVGSLPAPAPPPSPPPPPPPPPLATQIDKEAFVAGDGVEASHVEGDNTGFPEVGDEIGASRSPPPRPMSSQRLPSGVPGVPMAGIRGVGRNMEAFKAGDVIGASPVGDGGTISPMGDSGLAFPVKGRRTGAPPGVDTGPASPIGDEGKMSLVEDDGRMSPSGDSIPVSPEGDVPLVSPPLRSGGRVAEAERKRSPSLRGASVVGSGGLHSRKPFFVEGGGYGTGGVSEVADEEWAGSGQEQQGVVGKEGVAEEEKRRGEEQEDDVGAEKGEELEEEGVRGGEDVFGGGGWGERSSENGGGSWEWGGGGVEAYSETWNGVAAGSGEDLETWDDRAADVGGGAKDSELWFDVAGEGEEGEVGRMGPQGVYGGRSLAIAEAPRTFPGGLELSCILVMPQGVSFGAPAIASPSENDVVVMGTMTNITWKDFFEEATVPPVGDDDAVSATSGNLGPAGAANVDFGKVNVTLFRGDVQVENYFEVNNTDAFYRWTVPSDVRQATNYRVAVWEASSSICGISNKFGISGNLSINVTKFGGFNEPGTVEISPLRQGENTSTEGGGEIYSCGGSVEVEWEFTGLLDFVDIKVCQEDGAVGDLAGLEDEDLFESSSPLSETGQLTCLEPATSDSVLANTSHLNTTLVAGVATTTCGVWGSGFYANVSWAKDGATDVYGVSEGTVMVLGCVFQTPNSSNAGVGVSIYDPQEILWTGLTSLQEEASVDIIIRRKGTDGGDDEYYVVAGAETMLSTDGTFTWEDPASVFPPAELELPEFFDDRFYFQLFDAIGGGLLCSSSEFLLSAEQGSKSSDTSTLLLLLTPAALLLLCCCGVFFVACPYYDKIVRRRRQMMQPSLIDVDDTYVIDGEGQPAILALCAQVIPLAHAHVWPIGGSSVGGAGGNTCGSIGGGVGGGSNSRSNSGSYFIRRVPSTGSTSGHWARAVLAMGQSVTGSIGRAATRAVSSGGSSSGGGGDRTGGGGTGSGGRGASSGARGSGISGGGSVFRGRGGSGGVFEEASRGSGVGGRGAGGGGGGGEWDWERGGWVELVFSLSSWRGRRSGATWALGWSGGGEGGGDTDDGSPESSSNVASSSWYSRQSSRVDMSTLTQGGRVLGLPGTGRGGGNGGAGGSGGGGVGVGGGVGGRGGSGGSGSGWLARMGGGGAAADEREKVVTVVVTEVEASQVEIVEVARAVVIDENGVEIPTPSIVGMEIMQGFSDHGSFDDGHQEEIDDINAYNS